MPFGTAAEDRVKASRKWPWKPSHLPALSVYIFDEDVDPESKRSSSRELMRKPKLVIEGAVLKPAVGTIDDAMDALALEVEKVMDADETIGGKVAESMLRKTELEVFDEGEETVGGFRMTYDLDYQTRTKEPPALHQRKLIRDAVVAALIAVVPTAVLDALREAHVTTNIANAQEALNQAKDIIDELDV